MPVPTDRVFLTDSGLETDLVFNHGVDLPCFAAFPLLREPAGRALLDDYFRRHIAVAQAAGTGFVLETPTWRANPDWAAQLAIDTGELDALNRAAVAELRRLKAEYASATLPMVVSGCIGPRGDGYVADIGTDIASARAYHREQAASLAAAGAEMLSGMTMTTSAEAAGIALAARDVGLPVAISFTVETDGRLPSGEALRTAIAAVDAATQAHPAYFMINCAHPSHFADVLADGAPWLARLRGLRANASRLSHAELDAMTELDAGDAEALAADYAALRRRLPQLNIFGGCCGTDVRHVAAIAIACRD